MNTGLSIKSSRNILIPRFDTFGDLVLVEGFVSAVLEMAPEASVTLLVRKDYDQLAEMFPRRLHWETTSINPFAQVPRQEELAPFVTSLRGNSYDLVLFTAYSRTWLDDVVGAATAPALRVALGSGEAMPAQLDSFMDRLGIGFSFPVYDVVVKVEELVHETEKYRVLLEQLTGEQRSLRSPQLILNGDLSELAARVLAQRGLSEEQYLLCAPAGTANISIKAWPEAHFAGLIARIEQIFGIPALITGHENERSIVNNVFRLAEQAGAHPRVWLGMDGEMPLAAALTRKSLFYLGNDTGLMHAAAAFERPVIAFFGGGHWPRFLPAAQTGRVFVTPMPCFYCNWECVFSEALCVRGISFEKVLPEIEQFLQDLRGGRQSFRVVEQKVQSADLRDFFEQAVQRLDQLKKDVQAERKSFLKQSVDLSRLLVESDNDRRARLDQIRNLTKLLRESEADRAARLDNIQKLERRLRESEEDRESQFEQIQQLTRLLHELESDRNARLEQTTGLTRLLMKSESDRNARLEQITELTRLLVESEKDRNARLEQTTGLTRLLMKSESDRNARLEQTSELTRLLMESESDRNARLEQINELTRLFLMETESDRNARLEQITELTRLLTESESDRNARLEQITELARLLMESEEDRNARLEQITELTRLLVASEEDRELRFEQIQVLTRLLRESESDRAARLEQITELTQRLMESESDRNARLGQITELTRLLVESESDRNARLGQITELTRLLIESESDRNARLEQITELTRVLVGSEEDRELRYDQIQRLTRLLRESESDRNARLEQTTELTRLLVESESDRNARFEQITELTRLLVESESDRNARFEQLTQLTRLVNARLEQIAELTRLVDAARGVFSKIETSRFYRLARAMGFFGGLKQVIADFLGHSG